MLCCECWYLGHLAHVCAQYSAVQRSTVCTVCTVQCAADSQCGRRQGLGRGGVSSVQIYNIVNSEHLGELLLDTLGNLGHLFLVLSISTFLSLVCIQLQVCSGQLAVAVHSAPSHLMGIPTNPTSQPCNISFNLAWPLQ